MERCLASIITRHSPRVYIGPRHSTRHLSSTSPVSAQVKGSLAANKAKSDISRLDKEHKKIETVLREIARQIAALINQKSNYRMERALLNATEKLQFHGDITIEQSKSNAISAAVKTSSKSFADSQQIIIFVDGSLVYKPNGKSQSIAHLGAAVVYKPIEGSQGWEERRYFAISKKGYAILAELFAISQSLAVAIELIRRLRRRNGSGPGRMAAKYKVIIFTDCRSALEQVKSLRRKKSMRKLVAETQMFSDPNTICKLLLRSQRLHQIGARLELCWVPGHSGVEGNVCAHKAAYMAANSQGITIPLDERPQWIELTVTGNE